MSLKTDFQYYIYHQDELVKAHNGKFVVIKNGEIIGVYSNELVAVKETEKSHALGTFLVQKVEPGSGGYTQTFHSRVAFA